MYQYKKPVYTGYKAPTSYKKPTYGGYKSQSRRRYNDVKSRAIFLPPQVQAGLEQESKLSDFKVMQKLGEGSFGTVNKVKNKNTGKIYALKKIGKKRSKKAMDMIRMELKIMYMLDHENVVKLYSHFEERDAVYLIMELTEGGEVYDKLMKSFGKKFNEKTTKKYILSLCDGLDYLHNCDPPIIHRDIKAENLLLDRQENIKIADFGWSNFMKTDQVRKTQCGTLLYLAPEMVSGSRIHDHRVDIWAVGILIFEFLTGNPPFYPSMGPGKTGRQLEQECRNLIASCKFRFPPDFPQLAKDLVLKILKKNPKDRLTIEEIRNHSWLSDGKQKKVVKKKKNDSYYKKVKDHQKGYKDTDKDAEQHYGFSQKELQGYHFRPESMMSAQWATTGSPNKPKSNVDNILNKFNMKKTNPSPYQSQKETSPSYKKVVNSPSYKPKPQSTRPGTETSVNVESLKTTLKAKDTQITRLTKDVKTYKKEISDVFESLKSKTTKCSGLERQLKQQDQKIQEMYLKKKKYKTQSQQLATKVQNLNQGLAYYSQWNESLKGQLRGAGIEPGSGAKDKEYLTLIQTNTNKDELLFLQQERDNYKTRLDDTMKELNVVQSKFQGDMHSLRESTKIFMKDDTSLKAEIQRLRKEVQMEKQLNDIKREKIKQLQKR